ncbi:hypothetical protein FJV41_17475, partial [Myxococcus llanfairpwllgwyngyllgogerychwyrndrobwllllantysiliogogogochensis]
MRQRSPLLTAYCSAALLALLACNGTSELTQTTGSRPSTDEAPSTGNPPAPSPTTPTTPAPTPTEPDESEQPSEPTPTPDPEPV